MHCTHCGESESVCVCEICFRCESLLEVCAGCEDRYCDCTPCACEGWDADDSFFSEDVFNRAWREGVYDFVG